MRSVRRSLISATALAAAAAAGAIGAVSLAGGDDGAEPGPVVAADRELGSLPVEPVSGPPRGAVSREALRASTGQKLEYFQTPEPLEIAAGTEEGATLACPKGYFRAVNGYYITGQPATFLDLTAPEVAVRQFEPGTDPKPSKRNWVIAVYNAKEVADQVVFGVACLSKAK